MDRLVVVDPNPDWPEQFQEIKTYLLPFMSESVVRIEHVGSTSVPGLAAKPIIDIDIVVESEDLVLVVLRLVASAGYLWVGDLGLAGREAFEADSTPPLPEHHLYLVVENNRAHTDHWLLRDALIDNPALINRYIKIKRENAAISGGDRDRYTALKAHFVAEVLGEARRERGMEPVEYWEPELE